MLLLWGVPAKAPAAVVFITAPALDVTFANPVVIRVTVAAVDTVAVYTTIPAVDIPIKTPVAVCLLLLYLLGFFLFSVPSRRKQFFFFHCRQSSNVMPWIKPAKS